MPKTKWGKEIKAKVGHLCKGRLYKCETIKQAWWLKLGIPEAGRQKQGDCELGPKTLSEKIESSSQCGKMGSV